MKVAVIAILLICVPSLFAESNSPNDGKSLKLTDGSTLPAEKIIKVLSRECSNVSITNNQSKSDYTLEAMMSVTRAPGLGIEHTTQIDLTLFDRESNVFFSESDSSLKNVVKDLCHAIKTFVVVEVVDAQNLTQSRDARGTDLSLVNNVTGRRTHTDTSSIYVIVRGEHALLDCYERRTGCATLAPGKYYGEHNGDGIWISYRMPVTHAPMRNHYKIAGGW